MRKISKEKLSRIIKTKRESLNITQSELSKKTNINRAMLSKLENGDYIPSLEQLESLGLYFITVSITVSTALVSK